MANAEFEAVVDYYLVNAGPVVGRNFANATQQAVRLMLEYPEIGVRAYQEARRLVLQGFPYDLIYRVQGKDLVILAIACHSRRPGYWARRR
jgi:plasmid stabilization system protein ParE